ncbi:MAG: thioredoxin domain-containing protein [Verrucomicrobiota bacterium]|nr:thioredoxin domain-containing protein [Verrucomicrobiota bacterium]
MKWKTHRILVVVTTVLSVCVFAAGLFYQSVRMRGALGIPLADLPTLGSPRAPIEIVIFEDFRCYGCRTFNEEIFPQVESRYITSGRARYTFVPVAFMSGSKPLGNAAIAVHKQAPDRFFPYIRELFRYAEMRQGRESDPAVFVKIAKKVGGIDLKELEKSIKTERYYNELERNYQWAKRIMGRKFGTPALFVNGALTSTASFRAVELKIDRALEGSEP